MEGARRRQTGWFGGQSPGPGLLQAVAGRNRRKRLCEKLNPFFLASCVGSIPLRVPEDDAYQTFLEDEFAFEIALAAKGEKRLILQEPSIFCNEFAIMGISNIV